MGFEMDEDILQDFLIEAGEILEQLSEQLVLLEKSPEDTVLLNAIFRDFHTVKGGAGFLALTPLVETCHGAENVFDNLRNGGRALTSEVMDVILHALDTINNQFLCVQKGIDVPSADPSLLELLHTFSKSELQSKDSLSQNKTEANNQESSTTSSVDEITDDEFEQLLDEIHGKTENKSTLNDQTSSPTPVSDEITDDEFEALLDELHGKKSNSTVANVPTSTEQTAKSTQLNEETSSEEVSSEEASGEEASSKAASGEEESSKAASSKEAGGEETSIVERAKQTALAIKAENSRSVTQAEQTIRVNTSTLDTIMNMVGELVLVRNRLISLGADNSNEQIVKAVMNLDVVTADLQNAVMKTRMQPIKKVFGRFPRVVRDLARSLNKEIILEMHGEETDLDKNLVEALADPMVHLVRNSIDHGIELPEIREANGKPKLGTITLKASQEGDHILLSIKDDGGGMDADKLRSIAIERGLIDQDAAARLSDAEAFHLIFYPGFSTKKEISDISGRGVGMDVVKTAITQLNGSISIDSQLGKGTNILIKVPLTLAILPTLMVEIGDHPFAFPLSIVNEIIKLDKSKINTVNGQLTLLVRNKVMPLFYLQNWLCAEPIQDSKTGHVVITQLGHQIIAFVVDSLIGQEEVVIKPLDEMLQGTPGMAGATITSDGHIALILDIPSLLKFYA